MTAGPRAQFTGWSSLGERDRFGDPHLVVIAARAADRLEFDRGGVRGGPGDLLDGHLARGAHVGSGADFVHHADCRGRTVRRVSDLEGVVGAGDESSTGNVVRPRADGIGRGLVVANAQSSAKCLSTGRNLRERSPAETKLEG